ncbi:hypothetical protein AX17_005970 [Amanita inopinata Kibby_2008]|nr:hypothetical protein AX17_005970 [Amanita inopinata Kibby_2008]
MTAQLSAMPPEVLRRVALYAIDDDVPGPPKEIHALLLTCKSLYRLLGMNAGDFNYGVFTQKFDIHSPLRRLGKSVVKEQAGAELRRRFNVLKRIRSGSVNDGSIMETLWVAYTMLEDISTGTKCLGQLKWARLPKFLDQFIHTRLYERSEENDGWPILNARNSLVMALSWLCLDKEAVVGEMESNREEALRLLQPYVFAAFRYPIFGANEYFIHTSKAASLEGRPETAHGPYPPDPLPPSEVTYFGSVTRKADVPLASIFASMLYFARVELDTPMIPPHLKAAPYRTRAEANANGQEGPTLEDVVDFVDNCRTHFEGNCNRTRQTSLCLRLHQRGCYTLGSLTGRWQGSYMLPFIDDYQSWLTTSLAPSHFKTTGRQPLFLTLQEHYTCDHTSVIPHDDEDNGASHAWLPSGCQWIEKDDGIEVSDDGGTFKAFYKTYCHEYLGDRAVADVIVTGKVCRHVRRGHSHFSQSLQTDDRHAAAWGAYTVIGRVRLDDGLVMLSRQSMDGYGAILMRGYVATSHNFVGRLKGASSGIAPAGWEGPARLLASCGLRVFQFLFQMSCVPISLDTVPQEVLEHIAFYTATDSFLGPPSALLPLLSVNHHIHACLSIASNYHLYARIFAEKFDIASATRRLGADKITPHVLALELQRRCFCLKRLRSLVDARFYDPSEDGTILQDLLSHSYLMMLENDERNEQQLREYGKIELWLRIYWFDERGASRASSNILMEKWPPNSTRSSIAMWLLWFFLKPDDYDDMTAVMHILRIFALSAHQYHLTGLPWIEFRPTQPVMNPSSVVYYSQKLQLEPPPLATPAILSFLTLVNTLAEDSAYPTPLAPSTYPPIRNNSLEWECEWGRCVNAGKRLRNEASLISFKPGSIDGVWEGFFTYTEFTAYAALLAGAPPNILHKSMVVRHRQTWKLREHHLLGPNSSIPDSGVEMDTGAADMSKSLSPGDPLRSYFPMGTQITEHRDGVHIREPGRRQVLHYQRSSVALHKGVGARPHVKDIIITGEGHSAWGQFSLIGRVRPCDGFVSLSKEYVDGDRGKWLYRGYLVGNLNGNLAGRWRDTLSTASVAGYEGCFVMSRRR